MQHGTVQETNEKVWKQGVYVMNHKYEKEPVIAQVTQMLKIPNPHAPFSTFYSKQRIRRHQNIKI